MSRHQNNTQLFEKGIPISFEPDLQESKDVTPVPIILSSRQGIQSYVRFQSLTEPIMT